LLRDKTRKPGKTPIATQTTARVVGLTCTTPPHQAIHWTGRVMAKGVDISLRSAGHLVGAAAAAQSHPHLTRPRDPSLAAKPADVVGFYVDPPVHAVVLSLDERARSKRSTVPNRGCRSSRHVVRL
jgi:hypothetical protein